MSSHNNGTMSSHNNGTMPSHNNGAMPSHNNGTMTINDLLSWSSSEMVYHNHSRHIKYICIVTTITHTSVNYLVANQLLKIYDHNIINYVDLFYYYPQRVAIVVMDAFHVCSKYVGTNNWHGMFTHDSGISWKIGKFNIQFTVGTLSKPCLPVKTLSPCLLVCQNFQVCSSWPVWFLLHGYCLYLCWFATFEPSLWRFTMSFNSVKYQEVARTCKLVDIAWHFV